ncbi:amino acid ABC transporter substrate-binding protein [Hyphomicrobium sp.]|uniref:amino acid ABC transporter substrate-binding protein n=1 Tax=Hyphomicrobium sp. TaxID=82 RepID=UPI002E33265C|nr:amino acid ABC transporter substrate-binding protein [Hyphomicrobium sp.]HEX2843361.1 amino acid ABC transporter substrate-binding protein [Hyphomicrobium sp.]
MTADRQKPGGVGLCRGTAFAFAFALAVVAAFASGGQAEAATLDEVRARGHVICGISEGTPGFASVTGEGTWAGLDVGFCSAVATAALGRRDAVKFRVVSAANRYQALTAGEVDLLPRANSRTLSRDTENGVRFVDTLFHDGQGFLVKRGYAVASVLELSGTTVCVLTGTSAEQGLETFFQSRKMRYQVITAEKWVDAVKAYADGACTVLTGDITVLAAERSRFINPAEHVIMPELISKEMLGPIVRQGDEQWFSIVRWTLAALISAEELGIASQNIDSLRTSPNVDIRRFVGLEADLGQAMGLSRDWSYQVVHQVGNYGELFERNIGLRSPLGLERGVNNLWTRGGLLSAGPLR